MEAEVSNLKISSAENFYNACFSVFVALVEFAAIISGKP